MKITSGKWKGRSILAPEGKLKPTSDKVRQALFNILRPISGMRFLDLFAGSGSVGITALSEGAAFSAFVERNTLMFKTLKKNLDMLGCGCMTVPAVRSNALKVASLFPDLQFDIIFADPFYSDTLDILEALHTQAMTLLADGGIFVLEHGPNVSKACLEQLSGFDSVRCYGNTLLSFYRGKIL